MKAIRDFLPEILAYCPGLPAPMAEHALLNAAREFCARTMLIEETLAAINVVAAQRDYAIASATPTQHTIVTPITVDYDGAPITATSERVLDRKYRYWRSTTGVTGHYVCPTPSLLRLTFDPPSAITGGLEVKVAVKPAEGATQLDDLLYNEYRSALCSGAKASLMMMRGNAAKPNQWYDPEGARVAHVEFHNGILEGVVRARNSHTITPEAVYGALFG